MRELPASLAGHLDEGVTTLCRCWRVRRRDGLVQGFTDHDRDLEVAGTLYAARTGFDAAEAASELGFATGGGEVAGALSSPGLAEEEIAAGLYDDASVETWLVNWAEPDTRLLLGEASVGEIRRADGAFVAELRGPLHRFDEERGLLYRRDCSADLGDARCGVDLSRPGFRADGTVLAGDGALRLEVAGLDAIVDGRLAGGRLLWTEGANAGTSAAIAAHRAREGRAEIDLWVRAGAPIRTGDRLVASVGCDKTFRTCRDLFGNGPNFRGFPHLPGNGFVLGVAGADGAVFDGGSLFR